MNAEPAAPRIAVVDADVAYKASQKPVNDEAISATSALDRIFKSDIVAVFDSDLDREWHQHARDYALTWRTEMECRHRVQWAEPNPVVREAISRVLVAKLTAPEIRAREKDAHVVALAIQTPAVVVSGDDKARNGYSALCSDMAPWKHVYWCRVREDLALDAWCRGTEAPPRLCEAT